MLWFSDLSASDPTMILPAAAFGLTYINLLRAFGGKDASGNYQRQAPGVFGGIQDAIQTFQIVGSC